MTLSLSPTDTWISARTPGIFPPDFFIFLKEALDNYTLRLVY